MKTTLEEINALNKKLADLKFFLDSLADDLQYNYGLDNELYKKIKNALNDDTKWSI